MKHRCLKFALLALCSATALPTLAGPYATMAAQVKANGGVITVVASGGLETQTASALNAAAISVCHAISAEGVTVTAVQIIAQSGQLIRLVSGTTIQGC